jgi:uncharacterized membrane protein YuzA (DUF378 family)
MSEKSNRKIREDNKKFAMNFVGKIDELIKDVFKEGSFIYFMFWALVAIMGLYCLYYMYNLLSKGSCTSRTK